MVRQRQKELKNRINLRKCILILITASLLLTGCGGNSQDESKAEREVPVETAEEMADLSTESDEEESTESDEEEEEKDWFSDEDPDLDESPDAADQPVSSGNYDEPDIDLTKLTDMLASSEIVNMHYETQDFMGLIIRVTGVYEESSPDEADLYTGACKVYDGCCTWNGIDFILADGYERPKNGDTITVTGVFDTFERGKYTTCVLRDARV